jgi:hypothetical protein
MIKKPGGLIMTIKKYAEEQITAVLRHHLLQTESEVRWPYLQP